MAIEKFRKDFTVNENWKPSGDQPHAIEQIAERFKSGQRDVVLMGATGTGKSATAAWVIEKLNKPTLVVEPNKTLAAQMCQELRSLFPQNSVNYFVSYYDYYQPEAYIPQSDTHIEKDASINEEVDRLRHAATASVLTRQDCVVVCTVSCLYGLGSPKEYLAQMLNISLGDQTDRQTLLKRFVSMQYKRNDANLQRGSFRVRGGTVDIIPAYLDKIVRIELFGNRVEAIELLDPVSGKVEDRPSNAAIFPATEYVSNEEQRKRAIKEIRSELKSQLAYFRSRGKLLEAERLEERVNYDLESIKNIGFCPGIENYSRFFDGRKPGEAPNTLMDFFPDDFLTIIDESHITLPQIRGMYEGDRSRKRTLVDYGFRLPSACDNRPLTESEFNSKRGQTLYLSATPGPDELERSGGKVVEQIIRPTGLLDPKVEVRSEKGQVEDLIKEIKARKKKGEKVLVTTLTKKMAEDLSTFFREEGIKSEYLHSDIPTLDRLEILGKLQDGSLDAVVGINLLREGLDLPSVSLVAILDADKEGFLRSFTSLIQIIGRAARNVDGTVIMYASSVTSAMKEAIVETNRRRKKQLEWNEKEGVVPKSIKKKEAGPALVTKKKEHPAKKRIYAQLKETSDPKEIYEKMMEASKNMDFEQAAALRDELEEMGVDFRNFKK
ncbi:MAG: excinuclease ABC subunit UvrB [Aeriscardovia sp.]|nr:excinuclease ABC subunit UvrB [Aeriscardovia sp.]